MIKIAPIYKELVKYGIETYLIATAQHRDMMDMMLEVFGLKPDIDMNIMTHNQTLNMVASKVLDKMERVLRNIMPDVLLVQGDTTTAMASSIAAFHLGIKVGHIEAGLRSGNLYDPFPEEMNRRVIGVVSDYNFAPTRKAFENLKKEGIDEKRLYLTGNTVVDSLHYIKSNYDLKSLRNKIVKSNKYILVTLHRRENQGEKMRNILKGLKKFSEDFDIDIVFPVHKNPNVRKVVYEILDGYEKANLLEPVNYIEFLSLLDGAEYVLTDSGGIQEEAPSFGKLVVVARNTTERPELIESGWGILAGTKEDSVYNALEKVYKMSKNSYDRKNPFGDGKSSERIVKILQGEKYEEFKG